MKRTAFFTLTACIALAAACNPIQPVIIVEGGSIRGVPSDLPGITVFKGIPYAAPPVGDLRWKEPQAVQPWEGIRECDSWGPIAWQPGNAPGTFYGDEFYWEGTPEQDEDCLYLNVWAPTAAVRNSSASLPVALWIHGGAFINGYGYEVTMDGDQWAKRGVILVTINYRLGIFGFLSHPELTAEQGQSGNYGTLDQIAALRWVRDNIAAFGGDPSRITVFGQSAGAMSVKNLLTSPLSKDMIAGAIIQSGGGVGERNPVPDPGQSFYDAQGKEIMDRAGLKTLADMRSAPAQEVFAASSGMIFPHIDGYSLCESFDDAFYGGSLPEIPILIGYTKDDLGMLAGESVDRFCTVRDSQGFPVYEYEFLRELPTDEAHPGSAAGAFHSSELWYMFGTLDRSWRPFTEADRLLSERMLGAWTGFCKNGEPGWPAFRADAPFRQKFDIEHTDK